MDVNYIREIIEEAREVYNSGGHSGGMPGLQNWRRNYSITNGEGEVINEIVNYIQRRNSRPESRVFEFSEGLAKDILETLLD